RLLMDTVSFISFITDDLIIKCSNFNPKAASINLNAAERATIIFTSTDLLAPAYTSALIIANIIRDSQPYAASTQNENEKEIYANIIGNPACKSRCNLAFISKESLALDNWFINARLPTRPAQ